MSRLIEADELKKSIEEDEELKGNSLAYLLMNLMTCYIDDAPTIDAEPVRHGHWIEFWFDEEDRLLGELPSDYKCSVCGGIVPRITFQSGHYCPNCGAKMDE